MKSREAKLQERIELVERMAEERDGLVNADVVIRHNRSAMFYSRMRATKIA